VFFFESECSSVRLTGDAGKGQAEETRGVGDELLIFVDFLSRLGIQLSGRNGTG
jgi:hypothetical protein